MAGSFANRPEVLQLQHKEIGILLRSSQLTLKEYVCVVKRVKPRGSASAEYLRLAVPGSHIKDLLGYMREAFLSLVLASLLGAGATAYFVVRRGVRAQNRLIARSIQNLASGGYERRASTYPDHELHPLLSSINDMADRIQKHVRSISDQKQQWEAIFNGMEEGVLILDSRGRIRQHNLALSKLTRRAEQSVGKRPLEIIMSNELQSICDQVLKPLNPDDEGLPKRLSITMGDDRTYDVTVVRSELLDGRTGAIIVFHDVTELRRLERVRQDFVANVSHELRTPLTSVKGYVETLIEDENLDKSTATSFLRVIQNNTDHMVKMVDDLLQLARLQARGSASRRITMDASDALAAAWKTCEPLAAERKVRLVTHLPEEGAFIVAEPGRMVQIFRNLLENAIRYSPENAEIIVECTTQDRENRFSIRDDGPGIPWQHQQRVFLRQQVLDLEPELEPVRERLRGDEVELVERL
ncbi:MAG: PAS domain S-box protein, partial [Syntrophobacteraceae bacterium]|nr:PAS domain S-box protein [Syntrophobacteraceae bacterium]